MCWFQVSVIIFVAVLVFQALTLTGQYEDVADGSRLVPLRAAEIIADWTKPIYTDIKIVEAQVEETGDEPGDVVYRAECPEGYGILFS